MLVLARNTIILFGITLHLCTYIHRDSEFSGRCKNRHLHTSRNLIPKERQKKKKKKKKTKTKTKK